MVDKERAELIDLVKRVAELGGESALKFFRDPKLTIDNKSLRTFDPVTEADLASEVAMTNFIRTVRPDDSIVGEETGFTVGSSPYTWVLDPIDGTRAFISGAPVWTVLVSVNKDHTPILGAIYQPYTREMLIGGLGVSNFIRGEFISKIKVKSCSTLGDAILFSTFPEVGTAPERKIFNMVSKRVRLTRFGMDAYAFGLLANGHIDIVMEAGLKSYDICAPIAVIEAAGGLVTDWAGKKIVNGGKVLACGDKKLHMELIDFIASMDDKT